MKKTLLTLAVLGAMSVASTAFAAGKSGCAKLPSYADFKAALVAAQNPNINNGANVAAGNGGLGFHMWGTMVDRDGIVCAVAFTGPDRGAQWPGSRVISAQKANTANAFSLDGLALSTANLYSAVQTGGSLFGLQESNPVDANLAYGGNSTTYGQKNDFMVGKKIGGVNVFGGGLALYDTNHKVIGAIGVSGDTSCADHNIAWRTRKTLALDNLPTPNGGVGIPSGTDGLVYLPNTITTVGDVKNTGWGHPDCNNHEREISIAIEAGGPAT